MASKGQLVIRFAGDLRDFSKATGQVSNKLQGIAKVAGAAGIAAGAALAAGVVGSMSVEKANDKLAAQLGLSAKKSGQIGKIAGNLYKNAYGDSIEGVNDAVGAVMTSIDGMSKASGKRLEDVTAKALDFATAFEVDVARASQVAGQVMRTGLAKNATEAFDLMTAASQKVPKALREDVLDAADEYGQFFAGIGMNGKQTFAALVKGAEKGQFGIDKIGDAVKEFTIRSTDMSTASKNAYTAIGLDAESMANKMVKGGKSAGRATQDIVKGLLSMKPGAKQANAAIALFGTPLEDLSVQEIPAFLKQLQGGGKAMDGFAGSTKRMGKTLNDNAATNLESFKRQVSSTFIEFVGGKALPKVNEIASALATKFGPAVKSATEFLSRNTWVLKVLGVVLGALGAVLVTYHAMVVASAIATKTAAVMTGAWSVATKIASAAQMVWNAAMKVGTKAALGTRIQIAALAVQQRIASAATVAHTAITKGAAVAQKALNLAMRANPIGLVITAIGLLVAGLVWFFTKTKAGQKIVKVVWSGIKSAIKGVTDWWTKTAWPAIKSALKAMGSWFKSVGAGVGRVWRSMGDGIGRVWKWIKRNVIDRFVLGLKVLRLAFLLARDRVADAFGSMRDRLERVGSWIRKNVFGRMRDALSRMKDGFRNAKDGIGRIWEGLKKLAAKPINFVLGTVYNNGIRKWVGQVFKFFGKGNPLPKANLVRFAKGSEDHRAQIARAGAMRLWAEPETGGEAYIPLAQGKRARSTAILGQVASKFGFGLQKFANGGFSPGDFLKAVTSGPVKFVKDKVTSLVSDKFAGRQSGIYSMLRMIPGTIVKGLGDKLKGMFSGGTGGSFTGANIGAIGWRRMSAIVNEVLPDAKITSAFRPGAVTAGYGTQSYHALGRAVDIAGGPGLSAIWEKLNALYGKSSQELLYSPKGARQIIGKGVRGFTNAITTANHQNHVHWAMAKGGIVKARPGGTHIIAGEGGHDEAVVPLSGPHAPRGGGRERVVHVDLGPEIMRIIRRQVKDGGGNVQLVLGRG